MPRYKLTLEYLGTNFSGWQKQKNSYSIQEAIERASSKLLQQKIDLVVAGRTDAGVHAEGQVAHLDVKKTFCSRKMQLGINFYLLNDKTINLNYEIQPHIIDKDQGRENEYIINIKTFDTLSKVEDQNFYIGSSHNGRIYSKQLQNENRRMRTMNFKL